VTIQFRCQKCGKKLKAGDDQAGVRFKCSRCGTVATVPSHSLRDVSLLETAPEPAAKARRRNLDDNEMDLTPMVDVVFQLLIFFTITASFELQKSIHHPTPDPSEATAQSRTLEELEQDQDYVIVHVDQDDVIWCEDHQAPTRQELLARLREARENKKAKFLVVTAHGDAHHQSVVTVLDVGSAAGMERISLTTTEDE
jgi:biopolymer transport protein ExbD